MRKAALLGCLIVLVTVASLALKPDDAPRERVAWAEPGTVSEDLLFGPPTQTPPISSCGYNVATCARKDRYHTGIDFQRPTAEGSLEVRATNLGTVLHREVMNPEDQGMGSNLIVEHVLETGQKVYSSYSHLAAIDPGVKLGSKVKKGQLLGIMGGSGYGQDNYWGVHLHFEIKDAPVPFSPVGGPFWGYTPTHPDQYGYHDPGSFIGHVAVEAPEPPPATVTVTVLTPNKGAVERGSRVLVRWSTSGAEAEDRVSIELKRDSSSDLLDGVGYVRLAEGEENDGQQRVSIPIGIALAKDWRVLVRHDASGVSDRSDQPLRVRR